MNRPLQALWQNKILVGDFISSNAKPAEMLVLHGAGQGRRSRFDLLRTELASRGIGSAAFDCIGHGDTGGSLEGSSLRSRTEQSVAFVNSLANFNLRHIYGSSMGAYTAVQLTVVYEIQTLILNVPAMYDAAAYDIPFGSQFSEILRTPDSWMNSDGWQKLSSFKGKLLVISAGQDEIIPARLIDRIVSSAHSARVVEHLRIEESSHLLSKLMNEDREVLLKVSNAIERIVNS